MSAVRRATGGGGSAWQLPYERGVVHEGATYAILNGDAEGLRRALAQVRDVNELRTARVELGFSQRTAGGVSLLQLAAREGQEGCVEALLDAGARVEVHSEVSGTGGKLEADQSASAVHLAAMLGHAGCLRCLLESIPEEQRAGVVNHRQFTWIGKEYPVDRQRRALAWLTPLQVACYEQHPECVRLLLERGGAEVDQRDDLGRTELYVADEESMLLLIAHGADVHVVDHNGVTPLMVACQGNRPGCVKALLLQGVDIEARDSLEGYSALHHAALSSPVCVRSLLRHGASVASVSYVPSEERTPLHRAASLGNCLSALILLMAGANPQVQDKNKKTPLQDAQTADMRALLSAWNPLPPLQELCMRVALVEGLDAEALPEKLRFDLSHYLHPQCVSAFSRGVDADGEVKLMQMYGFYNMSYLHVAVLAGHPECVRALVDRGARRLNESNRWTHNSPLEDAAMMGDAATVRALIEGAATRGISLPTAQLQRALWSMILKRSLDGVRALLEAGADPTFFNQEDQLDYFELAQREDPRIYALLRFPKPTLQNLARRVICIHHLDCSALSPRATALLSWASSV